MNNYTTANKRLVKNSLFMSVRMLIILVISLYTTRIVLQVLGIESYGVYNVVAGFVTMFAFLNTSMATASQRYYNVELAKNGLNGAASIYRASLKIHVWLGILVSVIIEPIGLWYIYNKLVLPTYQIKAAVWIFNFSIFELFLNIICTPFSAAVMAHERMDFLAAIEIVRSVAKLGIVFLLYLFPSNRLIWFGLFNVLIVVGVVGCYILFCIKKFEETRYKVRVIKSQYRELIAFSSWGLLGSLAYSLRDQGVNLVLNSFFGPLINAARGISNQVNAALQGFVANLVIPARPQIIKSYAECNYQRAWELTFTISKITCLFFYAMSLPIILQIDFILHLWLGKDIPNFTSIFVIIMLVTNTFGTFINPLSTMVQANGKIKIYQISTGISNLMTVPLAYIMVKLYKEPSMAYIALFITMGTNTLCSLYSVHKTCGLSYREYFKKVSLPCVIVMLLSLPISIWPVFCNLPRLVKFVIIITVCVINIVILGYTLALNRSERIFVKNIYKKIIYKTR